MDSPIVVFTGDADTRVMELKVWVDGVVRVVCGLTLDTSCKAVVIALAQSLGNPHHISLQSVCLLNEHVLFGGRPLSSCWRPQTDPCLCSGPFSQVRLDGTSWS